MFVENYSAKTYHDIDNEKCSSNRHLMEQERLLNDRTTPMIYGTQSGFEGVISSQRWHELIYFILNDIANMNWTKIVNILTHFSFIIIHRMLSTRTRYIIYAMPWLILFIIFAIIEFVMLSSDMNQIEGKKIQRQK